MALLRGKGRGNPVAARTYLSYAFLLAWSAALLFRSAPLMTKYDLTAHQERTTLPPAAEPNDDSPTLLEDLMYTYNSDKSRDDHGYTKLYQMILAPFRHSVRNFTEVGISAGQSIQAWHRYFPHAEIHGFDIRWYGDGKVQENLERLPRFRPHIVDLLQRNNPLGDLGFRNESMDVILEDGPHTSDSQEKFLVRLFPLLKPGGYYIIEDVGHVQGGIGRFHERPELLGVAARDILEGHDSVWVDAAMGHRAWGEWVRRVGGMWASNRTHHNSHCVVIRKRGAPPREPMQMNYGGLAMNPDQIVAETGEGEGPGNGNSTIR